MIICSRVELEGAKILWGILDRFWAMAWRITTTTNKSLHQIQGQKDRFDSQIIFDCYEIV